MLIIHYLKIKLKLSKLLFEIHWKLENGKLKRILALHLSYDQKQ